MYLFGSIGQIFIIGILVFILRKGGVGADYTDALGMIFIALGGISSALWGVIVSVKNGTRFKKIIRDFFDIKKSYRYYPLILIFLLIDFCSVFFGGAFSVAVWYTPVLLFVKAIIFGGIEEIGWRYTFQPMVEKKIGFIPATLITFLAWGVWHFLYFYIEGTIAQVNVISFLAGLLTNCFMLALIFKKTKSLWLCVMTHALINTLSQLAVGGNEYVSVIGKAVIIIVSVYMVFREDKCKNTD